VGLAVFAAHAQASAVVVDGDHRALLDAAAEVLDARVGADTG
jgi:hypothetical protein